MDVKIVSHNNNKNNKAKKIDNCSSTPSVTNSTPSATNSNSTPSHNTPDHTPDSGIRTRQGSSGRQTSSEEDDEGGGLLDNELRQSISSTLYAALCGETPTPR